MHRKSLVLAALMALEMSNVGGVTYY